MIKNSKYLEPGWIRVYVTLVTVLFLSAYWVYELNTHTADDEIQHMTIDSRDEVKSMKSEIGYQKLEIQRVKEYHEKDIKQIVDTMNKGFTGIETLIQAMHRGD